MQQGAVRGMVETLDEYSSYIPPERVKSFRARLNGEMICTGLVLAGEGDGPAEVVGSLPDSPAHPPVPRPAHLQPAMPFFTPADRPAPWNRPCGHVIIGVG